MSYALLKLFLDKFIRKVKPNMEKGSFNLIINHQS